MQTKKPKHIGTLISYDLWKPFVILLKKKDIKISEFLRDSIRKYVKDNVERN